MNTIADFFLRAKHWQIFLLIFVVGFIGEISALILMPPTPSPLPFAAVSALVMCGYLAWLWAMGSFLPSMAPSLLKIKTGFFHFSLVFPAVYGFAFLALFNGLDSPGMLLMILPLHFFAMYCMLYNLYFVSKNFVSAETGKRTTSFLDYAGPFFLLWFYPVGVWFIQPRINALYTRRNQAETFTPVIAN